MLYRVFTTLLVAMLAILVADGRASTQVETKATYPCPRTQALMERAAKQHPEIIEIGIHAQPRGYDHSFRIASSDPDAVGEADDAEDLKAVQQDSPIVEEVGDGDDDGDDGWDVTMPLHAKGTNGPVGALGVLLTRASATDKQAALKRAGSILEEVEMGLPYEDQTWR